MTDLTATQLQVLAYVAAGSTAVVAARVAGVHRNTVGNWLRDEKFRTALREAHERKAILYEDQAEIVAAEAFAALRAVIADPNTSNSVKVRAALAMLDRAAMAPPMSAGFPEPEEIPTSTHKDAQAEAVPATHNDAQWPAAQKRTSPAAAPRQQTTNWRPPTNPPAIARAAVPAAPIPA